MAQCVQNEVYKGLIIICRLGVCVCVCVGGEGGGRGGGFWGDHLIFRRTKGGIPKENPIGGWGH